MTRWTVAVALAMLAAPGVGEAVAQAPRGPGSMRGDQMRDQMRDQVRGPMRGRRGDVASRPAGLDLRIGNMLDRRYSLDLTDRQVEELMALRSEARERIQPLRDAMATLREERREGTLDRDEMRAKMNVAWTEWREARDALSMRLGEVLEPRQRALLRLGARRPARR